MKLTSTVIPSNPEGKYPYYTLGFLIPHEMLRREFNRARIAIDNLDTVAAPWKADALLEWLDAFLIPLLHAHHHIEDNIIFPFYYALGIVPPERQAEDHISLIGRMNKLQSLSRQLVHYGHYGKTANKPETIRSYEDRVKKEFLDMIIHFERHFAEEEEFWPSLLEKYGEVSITISCSIYFLIIVVEYREIGLVWNVWLSNTLYLSVIITLVIHIACSSVQSLALWVL